MTDLAIILGSFVGYLSIAGVVSACFSAEYDKNPANVPSEIVAMLWPLAIVMIVAHLPFKAGALAATRIRRKRSSLPKAQVLK